MNSYNITSATAYSVHIYANSVANDESCNQSSNALDADTSITGGNSYILKESYWTLANVSANDTLTVEIKSRASNAAAVGIKDVWVEWGL
jgi:hypothetical protein